MQKELARAIDQLSKEKSLDKELVIEAVEEAMRSAARKAYGADLNVEAKYNRETGEVQVYKILKGVAPPSVHVRKSGGSKCQCPW